MNKKNIRAAHKSGTRKSKSPTRTLPKRAALAKTLEKNMDTDVSGHFYRIEIRTTKIKSSSSSRTTTPRGTRAKTSAKGGAAEWNTVTWLVGKDKAHISPEGELIIDDKKARTMLSQIGGDITRVKGDVFRADAQTNPPAKGRRSKAQEVSKKKSTSSSKN